MPRYQTKTVQSISLQLLPGDAAAKSLYSARMKITAIKTAPITIAQYTLTELFDRYLPTLPPRAIVALSSKVAAICEGRVVPENPAIRRRLIRNEADYYLAPTNNPVGYGVTIKSGILGVAAGVDYSQHHYILWPADPQATANTLRRHLTQRHGGPVGVILTDSRSTPLRRGTTGFGLAYSGFGSLTSYISRPDVFGHRIELKVANLLDGLAAGAVAVMGEGAQCTPISIIEDTDFVEFQDRDPTPKELAEFKIPPEQDVYAEMFHAVPWDKRPGQD